MTRLEVAEKLVLEATMAYWLVKGNERVSGLERGQLHKALEDACARLNDLRLLYKDRGMFCEDEGFGPQDPDSKPGSRKWLVVNCHRERGHNGQHEALLGIWRWDTNGS